AGMQITAAQAQISDTTLRNLSTCDASFFRSLQKDGAAFADKVPLAQRGEYSGIKVANRYQENANSIMFSAYVPAEPGEQPEQTTDECEIKDTFSARTISPTLTGDATRFICINQKDGSLDESALVHDLGVTMALRYDSQKNDGSTSRYQDLEVVQ
ncbi:MAG: hypothetical protein RLZZ237_2560, partial [Pseudomonadota bacterium]